MKLKHVLPLCTSLSLLWSAGAIAADSYLKAEEFPEKLRFGSEMTISSDDLVKSYPKNGNDVQVTTTYANLLLFKMNDNLKAKYQNAGASAPQIELKSYHSHWARNAITLRYPHDFQMTVFPDPGVFEMNTSPSSLKDIEKNSSLIQEDFFNEGKKVGLEPALFTGSGHIHIEVSKLHPVTVRNFLADFFNATGLAAGALNEDIYNSVGMGEIPKENKEHLRKAFYAFDSFLEPKSHHLPMLVHRAYMIPYQSDLEEYRKARKTERPDKYFAVSFYSFDSLGTIEIRCIRPQASAQSYQKLVKLFVSRMQLAEKNRLNGIRTPIKELKSLRGKPQEILAEFDRYVTEAGLDFKDYVEFVLPWWQLKDNEVDHYMAKRPHPARTCHSVHTS